MATCEAGVIVVAGTEALRSVPSQNSLLHHDINDIQAPLTQS